MSPLKVSWKLKGMAIRAWDRLREARANPLAGGVLRIMSAVHGMVLRLRDFFIRFWSARVRSFPVPVISVGNLALGGTGKTPMVRYLAEKFARGGCQAAVLSRGYGRRGKGTKIVSDGEKILLDYPESGDEPALLSRWLPQTPVVVGKDRVKSGELALRNLSPRIFLLDDGFSYRKLEKDVEIMMMAAGSDEFDFRLFPDGILREPGEKMIQADVTVLVGDSVDPGLRECLRKVNPGGVVFRARYRTAGYRSLDPALREDKSEGAFRGKEVMALAGVATPESFFSLLSREGMELRGKLTYPDHYPYRREDILRIERAAREAGAEIILTTEKDGVRLRKPLREEHRKGLEWWEVLGELELEREDEFLDLIRARLEDRNPAIFLDRDGTINEERGYITEPKDLRILPGAEEALRRINLSPYWAVLVSNQSAVGRGMARESQIRMVNSRLEELLAARGAWLDGIYYCPHAPEAGCACRKPETGLARKAVAEIGIELEGSYMIGDKGSDIEMASRLGIRSVLIMPGIESREDGISAGEEDIRKYQEDVEDPQSAEIGRADFVARDLAEAVDWIMGSHQNR